MTATQKPCQTPTIRPTNQSDDDGEHPVDSGAFHQQCTHTTDEGYQGTNRKVNVGGDDDHHHTNGQDDHVSVLLNQGHEGVRLQQHASSQDLEGHDDDQQCADNTVLTGIVGQPWPAGRSFLLSLQVLQLRRSSGCHLPFLGHTLHQVFLGKSILLNIVGDDTVGHRVNAVTDTDELGQLGGNHDDGLACIGKLIDDFVDLILGADVDASGRLIEDEDVRLRDNPLGEQHFLLVTTGEGGDIHIDVMALDVEVLAVLFNFLALKVVVHNPALADLGQGGQGRVLSDVLQQVQTVALTILGGVGETCVIADCTLGILTSLPLTNTLPEMLEP